MGWAWESAPASRKERGNENQEGGGPKIQTDLENASLPCSYGAGGTRSKPRAAQGPAPQHPKTRRDRTGSAGVRSPCGRSRRRAARRPLPWWRGPRVRGSEGPEVPRRSRRHRGRSSLKCNHPRGLKSHFRCKVPGAPCGENSSPDPRTSPPGSLRAETIGWDLWARS